jgi:hypothetical protein
MQQQHMPASEFSDNLPISMHAESHPCLAIDVVREEANGTIRQHSLDTTDVIAASKVPASRETACISIFTRSLVRSRSAVTRHRFLFQIIWLWERRSFVLPTSPETEMEC